MGSSFQDEVQRYLDKLPNLKLICSAGFCGGLKPSLDVGHVVLVSRVVTDADMDQAFELDPEVVSLAADALSSTRLPVAQGCMVSVREAVLEPTSKRELGESRDALAVDMESAMLARMAKQRDIAFAGLRSVSDGVEDQLPREVLGFLDKAGRVQAGNILKFAIRGTGNMAELWRLKDRAKRATLALRTASVSVLPKLVKWATRQ